MKFALIGNPNSGKTTLFNLLTGEHSKVSNYSGVTLSQKSSYFYYNEEKIELIDLPGIYSLCALSEDEIVSRNFLLEENFDIIINVLDATNLERNLYLTTELFELNIPIILAINMTDSLSANGGFINIDELENTLSIKCVPISASKNKGIDSLIEKSYNLCNTKQSYKNILEYSSLRDLFCEFEKRLFEHNIEKPLFHAVQFLNNDMDIVKKVNAQNIDFSDIISFNDKDFDIIIASDRYNYIKNTLRHIYEPYAQNKKNSISEKIDKIIINKYIGIPIFLIIIFLIFTLTFSTLGIYVQQKISYLIDIKVATIIQNIMIRLGVSPLIISLLIDGMIKGVGMVLSFLPQLLLLFLFLSLLEDIGYMSRVSFLMDNLLRRIGLSGKSFIPIILGSGCTVPAILATKTFDTKKDRVLTILILPFISCGARMTIYIFFANIFFLNNASILILSLYALGILITIISSIFLNNTICKNDDTAYLMELAPYRLPRFQNTFQDIKEKSNDFLNKIFTIILASSIIIWFLQRFDFRFHLVNDNSYSILGQIGQVLTPAFKPLGFGSFETSVSLITGLITKESIVSTLSILYSTNNSSIVYNFDKYSALSFLVFVSLYSPCISTLSTIKKELNSNKLVLFSITYNTVIAYTVSLVVYTLLTYGNVAE